MAASPVTEGASLESAVEALARALGVDGLRIIMAGGAVHIEGTAPSYRHKRSAAELIGLMMGASSVVNGLRVAPRVVSSDHVIARRLATAFEGAPEVDATTIELEVRNGVVELRGVVGSLSALCAAERAVWSVDGVADLVDELRVAGSADSPKELARQLAADICACLGLPATSIRLEVRGNAAYLEGTVPSPYHRLAAEELARTHELVQEVVNSLAVAGTTKPASASHAGRRRHPD